MRPLLDSYDNSESTLIVAEFGSELIVAEQGSLKSTPSAIGLGHAALMWVGASSTSQTCSLYTGMPEVARHERATAGVAATFTTRIPAEELPHERPR